ncbi:MAG: peptidase C1 [Calditrichaeota bacterium]|nr:MAG: peptidase C1 [Calditrichota bacterium]
MDVEGMDLPASKDQFTFQWHNDPISQGYTGTCWSFCTTSFFESEIYRLTGKKVKLSEMFTVYWEYIEKAKRYVRERGDSEFSEGSMGNHFPVIWKKYGIVPAESYTGMLDSIPFHDHQNMYKEMMAYLKNCREINFWNEPAILDNIKAILDYYIGEPPATIQVDGKKMSPLEYYKKVLKINADDYVDILSLKEKPYYEKVEYPVPDNWWHSEEYYNVPLDEFMQIIKKAIRDGYTMVIGGDVSEAGYNSFKEVAMIPTFDIPSEYINEDARQFRFSNKTTTDDHGIHVVGYLEKDGADWYLIKDSGSGSRNGPNKGYYFYHEDYIKLKMMDFTIHKDAAKEILTKFK